MTAKELVLELLKLDRKDWDKQVETEGCDCFGPCGRVESDGQTVILYRNAKG